MTISKTQARARKLADRERRRATLAARRTLRTLPTPNQERIVAAYRAAIAEAVHQTVCAHTGGDGFGHCLYYAAVAAPILRRVTGRLCLPVAGSIGVLVEPPDGWFGMLADQGGLPSGEFHCWNIVTTPSAEEGYDDIVATIDLASRHYRRWVDHAAVISQTIQVPGGRLEILDRTSQAERVRWTRPGDPPPYVWVERHIDPPPDWLIVRQDEAATCEAWRWIASHTGVLTDLVEQAAARLTGMGFRA